MSSITAVIKKCIKNAIMNFLFGNIRISNKQYKCTLHGNDHVSFGINPTFYIWALPLGAGGISTGDRREGILDREGVGVEGVTLCHVYVRKLPFFSLYTV